jgi:superfamily II DNA or RNA helicase
VVISDKPDAREALEEFAVSDAPYLIAIRMVSEGVDIPRLRVLVWLTRTQTELFFAQGTARVVRIPDRSDSGLAVVFMPSLDALRELAQGIDKDRAHEIQELEQQIIQERDVPQQAGPGRDGEGPVPVAGHTGPADTTAAGAADEQLGFSSFSVQDVELERTFLGSEPHDVEHHHYAQQIIDEDGMPQTVVAVVRGLISRGRIQLRDAQLDPSQVPEQQAADLRIQTAVFRIRKQLQDELNTVCKYIARRYYEDNFKFVRGRVNSQTGASAEFGTIEQTKQGILFARTWAVSLDDGGPR